MLHRLCSAMLGSPRDLGANILKKLSEGRPCQLQLNSNETALGALECWEYLEVFWYL